MLGRLGIRGKILAVVAVPALVLLTVATFITVEAFQSWAAARNTAQLLEVSEEVHDLTVALQTERDTGTNFIHFFGYATTERDTREATTDAAYDEVVATVAQAPAQYREEAQAAKATLDAILTRYGVDANGDFVDLGANSDGGYSLAAARAIDVEIVPVWGSDLQGNPIIVAYEDWPVWPSAEEMRHLEDVYARLQAVVADLAASTPAGTGIVSAITRYGQLLNVEFTAANNFLRTPSTYVPPEGQVVRIVPEMIADYEERFREATGVTDARIEDLREVMDRIEDRPENAYTRSTLDAALTSLTTPSGTPPRPPLDVRRDSVRLQNVGSGALSGWYHDVITLLSSSQYATAGILPDRSVAESLTAFAEIDTLIEAMRLEEMTGARVIRQDEFSTTTDTNPTYISLAARTDAALEGAQVAVARAPAGILLPNFGASFDATDNINWQGVRTRLANNEVAFTRTLGWSLQLEEELTRGILPVQDLVWTKAKDLSVGASQAALFRAFSTLVGALAILGLSFWIAMIIARRIIGPLRRLTTTATAVRQELPRLVERVALPGQTVDVSEVQIPVESSDEVGRLAEAFNAVNAATLTIAGEQAALRGSISEMFVNVARRDQVLLNRQLASIDEMERSQDDPEVLTRLFALDHLATRMRRNSESLLVLAGIDTGRRMRRPMPISDVIRTASSEIELYERVQLELDADPAMVGHSALTAGHLFAELLENATVFSDPGTSVVVRTSRNEDGVTVEIIDQGIGMTPEELHEANSRVRSTAASEILGAQRLGLFVVGRIARRLGARVEITSEESKGTTATVIMPLSLFDFSMDPEPERVSNSAVDESLHVPAALIGHRAEDEIMDVYSDDVMTPAIAGMAYRKPEEEEDDEIALLVQEDFEAAPVTEEVNLEEYVEGKTAKGLPSRKRRPPPRGEAMRDTGTVLGLPETPTTGQLAQAVAGSGGIAVGEPEETAVEQRSAMFRGFRSRRGAEAEIGPNAESLGHAVRRGAIAPETTISEEAVQEETPELEEVVPSDGVSGTSKWMAEAVPEEGPELPGEPELAQEATAEGEGEPIPQPMAQEEPESIEVEVPVSPEPVLEPETEAEAGFEPWSEAAPREEEEATIEPVAVEPETVLPEPGEDLGQAVWPGQAVDLEPRQDLDMTIGSIETPEVEPVVGFQSQEEGGFEIAVEEAEGDSPEDLADVIPIDVGPMPEPAAEGEPRFSWTEIPTADEPVPTLEDVLQVQAEGEPPIGVLADPLPAKEKKAKEKRSLLRGRKKKAAPEPVVEDIVPEPEPFVGPAVVMEESPEGESAGTAPLATGQEYDEWGLPVAQAWPPEETLAEEVTPVYDEWGLPIVEGAASADELDLPAEGVPTPEYEASLGQEPLGAEMAVEQETPMEEAFPSEPAAWAEGITAEQAETEPEPLVWGIEASAPLEPGVETGEESPVAMEEAPYYMEPTASAEAPVYDLPPVTDEVAYAAPEAAEAPVYGLPPVTDEVAYAAPEAAEAPAYDFPPATGEVAYAEPPVIEDVTYFPAPPLTDEIPELSVEPLRREEASDVDQGVVEAQPWTPADSEPAFADGGSMPVGEEQPSPQESLPSFDTLISPVAETEPGVPSFAGEIADLTVQPVSGEFFSPIAVPEAVDDLPIPGFEPEPLAPAVSPAAEVVPDMPPPTYEVPDMPPPEMPAYGAEAYPETPYGGEDYGAAVHAYSPDEFARPYGWESAGASALEAASDDRVQGGYSPEAFVPTAPALPDGSEAEMTSAVFSELSSLAVERPKVVRTKAGLQRRAKEETPPPTPPSPTDEIEVKPITRDPEAVRSSFSSFHSATNRARDAGDAGSDVRGAETNEMTP